MVVVDGGGSARMVKVLGNGLEILGRDGETRGREEEEEGEAEGAVLNFVLGDANTARLVVRF